MKRLYQENSQNIVKGMVKMIYHFLWRKKYGLVSKLSNLEYIRQVKERIYPYFHELQTGQNTELIMEGKKILMIGSNNYLGLTSHPDVINAGIEALKKYGSGCSGSRFLNGTLDIHVKLEKELAIFLNKEAALTFSTGFQSNLSIISALAGRNDVIVCDKENHASIYDACRLSYAKMLRYEHNDMEDLEKILFKGKIIITLILLFFSYLVFFYLC